MKVAYWHEFELQSNECEVRVSPREGEFPRARFQVLRRMPDEPDRIMPLEARGDVRMRNVADKDETRILRSLISQSASHCPAGRLLLVAAVLLVAADNGPRSAGTGQFDILGMKVFSSGASFCCEALQARPVTGQPDSASFHHERRPGRFAP